MHCQVPGVDYSLSKLAIHAALESATSLALSHTGILYIAETDEKKINRVRQVRGRPQRTDCLRCPVGGFSTSSVQFTLAAFDTFLLLYLFSLKSHFTEFINQIVVVSFR